MSGSIEVICGTMFGGKTEELIRRLRRVAISGSGFQLFKHKIDKRYHESNVVSHSGASMEATPVECMDEIVKALKSDTKVLGIDEGQFFGSEIVECCMSLADSGLRIIVAGLDTDYMRKPFGPIPALGAVAELITKCNAVCSFCRAHDARYSYRIASTRPVHIYAIGTPLGQPDHVIGGRDVYMALCRKCYVEVSNGK